MRRFRGGWLCLAVIVVSAVTAAAQSPSCDGPNNAAEVIPCTEANTPQQAARAFLERELATTAAPTADSLAQALSERATTVCDQAPERNTYGPLYGIGRWGCENGYSFRKLCGDSYYLEKEVDAGYGMAVVTHVVVSSGTWNVFPLDTTAPMTVTRTDTGDVRLSVILSLRQKSVSVSTPANYTETLRSQYRGQATALKTEILEYCRVYRETYCQELRSLAAMVTRSTSVSSGVPITEFSVTVKVPGHLAATLPLDLSSDEVSLLVVTGTVRDDRGTPVGNAEVTLAGTDVVTRTAGDGAYQLSSFGAGTKLTLRRVDVTLERATVDIAVKTADASPIFGIAADGVSRLTLQVTTHGIRPDSITVAAPSLGEFERATPSSSPLTLDKNGSGTLTYVAPSAVPAEALTDTLIVGGGAGARTIPAVAVSLSVRFTDLDGVPQTSTVVVKVCRPPVLLVQSYFGGTATWTRFADYARSRKLDSHVTGEGLTWNPGNVQISDWAKDLSTQITDLRASYASSGIRIVAVDVVAHSLAGLVTRSLLEGSSPRTDVRKLILVGVPNHGIAWIDQEVGAAAVRWLGTHPAAAAEIREGSTFLRGLNPSRVAGMKTEYVNLVGRRPSSLSASRQGSSTVQDDGIVSAASSHLDGVADVRLDGVVHAPGLLPGIPSLTDSPDVWSRIVDLLTGPIPDSEPDTLQLSLRAGRQASASLDPQTMPWTPLPRFPSPVASGVAVRTAENGYASVAVARSGQTWGTISLDAKTEIVLRASSPSLVRVEVISGRVRFRVQGSAAEAGNFEVYLAPTTRSAPWYMTQPDVRALGVGTDFVVAREDANSILALIGPVIVECTKGTGYSAPQLVEGETGIRIRAGGSIEDETIPARGWWSSGPWSQPVPFLSFPLPVMAISLLGLAAAIVYHIRARRALAARSGPRPPTAL